MSKIFAILTVLFGLFISDLRGGSIAVVDLTKVAVELNVIQSINETLIKKLDEDRQGLISTQAELRGEIDTARAELGEQPSDDQKIDYYKKNKVAKLKLTLEQQKLQREIQAMKLKLIDEFRAELKPIALRIAKEKGYEIVLNTVMPPVYVFDETADITEDVLAAAKQAGLTR